MNKLQDGKVKHKMLHANFIDNSNLIVTFIIPEIYIFAALAYGRKIKHKSVKITFIYFHNPAIYTVWNKIVFINQSK